MNRAVSKTVESARVPGVRIPLSPLDLPAADSCEKRLSLFPLREGDSNPSPRAGERQTRRPTGGKGAKVVACAIAHTTIASTLLVERSDTWRRQRVRRVFTEDTRSEGKTESPSLRYFVDSGRLLRSLRLVFWSRLRMPWHAMRPATVFVGVLYL